MFGLSMIELTAYALQVILIMLAIAIVVHKNNGTIIILIASFSLVTASLYIINNAPDVALAEVAIGSAIIPLIYVISISRQREFIILDRVNDDFLITNDELTGIGYVLLKRFADYYHLELNITNDPGLCSLSEAMDKKLCQNTNVDLVISKDYDTGRYILKGSATSTLMHTLEDLAKDYDNVDVEMFKGSDLGE